MHKSIYHGALALATFSMLATAVFAAPSLSKKGKSATTPRHAADSNKERVTLEVGGADSTQAAAITKALTDSGLHGKLHEGKGNKGKDKGMHMTAEVDRGADLSQWIKVIGASAPKGQPAPTLDLIIYAPINNESGTQAIAQLEKVKGVDAKHSTADVKSGELHVRLTGEDKVSADDISSAVRSAGIVGHFTKMGGKGKQT